MYFRSEFLEIWKTIHFWEPYALLNLKNYVYIFSEPPMAAILIFKMAVFSPKFGYISASKHHRHMILVSKHTFSTARNLMQ